MPASPLPTDPETPAGQKKNGSAGNRKKAAPDKTTNTMNGNDFAKAIGINKPANVRDKIKRWQVEVEPDVPNLPAAAAAPAPATASAASAPSVASAASAASPAPTAPTASTSTPLDSKPNWKPAHTAKKSVDSSPERPTSTVKPAVTHNPLDDDVLTATAPKKRVISDSHWRQKQSPPKETGRPPPKTIPNAWVRPSKIIKNDRPPAKEVKEVKEVKPAASTTPLPLNPLLPLVSYVGRSTGQTRPPPKQRRPSKPSSAENEQRPISSGSGSAKDSNKSADKADAPTSSQPDNETTEMVRVRRRRRARTSPRGSLSPEPTEAAPYTHKRANKSESALAANTNTVTVEYAGTPTASQTKSRITAITSPRDDEIRERRRRRRPRSQGDRTAAQSPRGTPKEEPAPTRRRSRRSYPRTDEEDVPIPLQEPDSTPKPSRRRSRRSWPRTSDDDVARTPVEPAIAETIPSLSTLANTTPAPTTKTLGSRLEAWLSGTPDPFVESSSRRRTSKESMSSLDLQPKEEKASDGTTTATSTDTPHEPAEQSRRCSSGSGSSGRRRRRRRRSREIQVDSQPVDEAPSSVVSTTVTAESSVQVTESEVSLSPTPTLKRRGARRSQHSPTKSRSMSSPLRETMSVDDTQDDLDTASAISSTVDASTVDMDTAPLRPRPLSIQRALPSRGKKLSTIVSVESSASATTAQGAPSDITESDHLQTVHEESVMSGVAASDVGSLLNPETSTIVSRRSTRRRRLASHADLISVLSMPKTAGAKSIMSARSIRTNRSRLATATIEDIMRELASDEAKYMRELRTIVDGVIPVLLSCVLSKSDSAVAAGLFSRSATTDPNDVTKPIVNMGVCLERLKTLHKRVPTEDAEAFVSWAQSAQRVYSDYIAAWRLGFQDVVISLAPADDDPFQPAKVVNGPDDGAPWDEGMPRNAEGYVVNGNGERVDVAYMLKRPLVRLKYLAKTMRGIHHVKPSDRAENMSTIFQDLVAAARKRSNDEQARLEDEAAASIDPTRARDPRSLAPLAGVRIDPKRCVRARDHFDLHLYHSSGQEISCRVEILLRDNMPGTGAGGDVLICEVDSTGRWLLLPPIQLSKCSARNGDAQGEIIVMIRGNQADGSEWSEVMSLLTDDEQAGFDWVQMLGLNPIPPQISEVRKSPSAVGLSTQRPTSSHESSSILSAATESTAPQKSRTPSPHEIEIPIGEQHTEVSKVWNYDTPEKRRQSRVSSPTTPPSEDYSNITMGYDENDMPHQPVVSESPQADNTEPDADRTPRSLKEAVRMAGDAASPSGLKRARATKRLAKDVPSPIAARASRQITLEDPEEPAETTTAEELPKPRRKSTKRRPQSLPATESTVSSSSRGYSVWMPSSDVDHSDESDESDDRTIEPEDRSPPGSPPSPQRPQAHRRVSSVPSLELPSIPRQRKTSTPSTPIRGPREAPKKYRDGPASAPSKMEQRTQHDDADTMLEDEAPRPPPTPPHRPSSPLTPVTLKGSKTPVFTPSLPGWKNKRRSSSPLKHEYEPSTCTEESTSSSSSESEEDVASDEELSESEQESLTSDSSEDELDDDVPMPLMPIGYPGPRGFTSRQFSSERLSKLPTTVEEQEEENKAFPKVSPPASIYTLPNGTITPSQSASNTPYRAVPQGSGKASKTIASIFAWSEAGRWDSLHPDECSIVVTPGKIEVFEITAHHSKPFMADGDEIIQTEGRAPLIAVELTPLVPLRKSTAIDISIRSPPTEESRIKTGNNIMLRSRNPAECAQLYAMINQSRINNPTYMALQNARGPYGQTSWAEAMDRQNAARANAESSSGWLGGTLGRRSSYRKTSTRAASISAATESSVGTMNTALKSALGRFSFGKRGMFSVRDSTLGSRSTGSLDGGSRPDSGSSTPGETGRAPGAPAGITNSKCRLYERESSKKWRDMGSARLTIILPSPNPSVPSSPTNPRQRAPGTRDHKQERRIVVTGKSKGQVLLDVTLSETCFERVARSGIAVSVWEDHIDAAGQVGGVANTGGVLGARARVFMVQMKSERECAYCFSLLGKLRY
ncbi:hypothetical protein IAQ61_005003 [Plenodomus lingam]|uniref:uncharacterized protein n=1 Tax=Leptosphaeria maculans TaxID=5022 RepID=UPI00332EC62D|nr:hypothetical protein IAQ61_005003 [Plenodomus lingam]